MSYYIYKHLNADGKCIYVGLTIDMKSRQQSHISTSSHKMHIDKIMYTEVEDKTTMVIYEKYLINKIKPKFNKKDSYGDLMPKIKLEELKFKAYELEADEYISKFNRCSRKIKKELKEGLALVPIGDYKRILKALNESKITNKDKVLNIYVHASKSRISKSCVFKVMGSLCEGIYLIPVLSISPLNICWRNIKKYKSWSIVCGIPPNITLPDVEKDFFKDVSW